MKTLLLILATAGVTFASAYFIVTNQASDRAKAQFAAAQSQWQKEKADLESALADAKNQSAPTTIISTASHNQPARLSAKDILDKLVAIKPGVAAERNHNFRLIVHYLESLTDCGTEALPTIKGFLALNQDIDYTTEDSTNDPNAAPDQNQSGNNRPGRNRGNNNFGGNNNNNGIFQFRRGGQLRTDFVIPPSLRLGLVDVLKNIGGDEAEAILASVLEKTGRGIEVDYVAKVLQEMAPDKFRTAALAAAKDLLNHPIAVDNPNQVDDLSEGYLFDVLRMYNDTSFSSFAQNMLVGPDGRLDRNALNYLTSLLKDQAIPALYQAYNNPNLTNQFDKMNIGRSMLTYVGDNNTANQFFTDTLNNPDIDSRLKMFSIAQLAGAQGGPFNGDAPTNPQVIQSRVQLLTSLQTQYAADQQMSQAITATIAALQSGQPMDMRAIFRQQRNNRGGNNNNSGGQPPGQGN